MTKGDQYDVREATGEASGEVGGEGRLSEAAGGVGRCAVGWGGGCWWLPVQCARAVASTGKQWL